MAGRTKESGNRQNASSLRLASAGFLLNRLLHLINHINASIGLIGINYRNGSFDCFSLIMDDEIAMKQEISEFLGLLFYMQNKYNVLLMPHKAEIIRLKNKLGIYFV